MDPHAGSLDHALTFLGELLHERGQRYEIVVIGGSALLLLGLHIRPTRDLDVLALVQEGRYVKVGALPTGLRQARDQVAATLGLDPNWLNTGPFRQLVVTTLLDFGIEDADGIIS